MPYKRVTREYMDLFNLPNIVDYALGYCNAWLKVQCPS